MTEARGRSRGGWQYELWGSVSIPQPLMPDVATYIRNENPLTPIAEDTIHQLTGWEPEVDQPLTSLDVPAVIATALDMRGRVKSAPSLDAHKATLLHRLAGTSFARIGEELYAHGFEDTAIAENRLNHKFHNSFLNKAVEQYEMRPEFGKHPLGRVGMLADYVDAVGAGNTKIVWTPVERQDRSGAVAEDPQLIKELLRKYDMYRRVMDGELLDTAELAGATALMFKNVARMGLLHSDETRLFDDRMQGSNTADSEQIKALLSKVDRIIAPRLAKVQERDPAKQEKVVAIKKILGAFVRGRQPVGMIREAIERDQKVAGDQSVYRSVDSRYTKLYIAAGLQRAFYTPLEQ